MPDEILLAGFAFATSTLTAISGIGGGMILIALMPGFIPAPAIIPVHAMVQLVSNASRALFGWRFLRRDFLLAFLAGAVAGGLLSASIAREIDLEYTPLFIAAYILYSVWWRGPRLRFPGRGEFVAVGFVQTALGMLVGATGPMGQAGMLRRQLGRDALVVTAAAMMSFTHLVKILLFAWLGFSFFTYWQTILGMSLGVIGGALLGTRLRYRIPQDRFYRGLKWLLTLLALRMIYLVFA